MKKLLVILIVVITFITFKTASAKTLTIFACEPEWASLAKEITKDRADTNIITAVTAQQNPHYIDAKPSLISDIRRADMVFCSGADLEVGWLPVLLQKVSNPQIMAGGDGNLMASDFVQKLQIPEVKSVDRIGGDIHPYGNPHIHLDPNNITLVADVLLNRLKKIDSNNADLYQNNYDHFIKKWDEAIARWEKKAAKLKGLPIVVQHDHWFYLNNWLGLEVVAKLEEKPGVPPSSKYLAAILNNLQAKTARLIVYAPFENKSPVNWLSAQSGIKAVALPYTVGGAPDTDDLFKLFDATIDLLIQSQNK